MKPARLILLVLLTASFAFATGWAFRAYLQPDAVVGFANRILFCN